MLVILSPARNLRSASIPGVEPEKPLFLGEAMELVASIRTREPYELESILEVNAKRALILFDAYRRFDADGRGSPALAAYDGAAYRKIDVGDFSMEDFLFAQEHLRTLSALYGVVRPFDGLQNHRLGMNYVHNGQNLYAFWGDKVARALALGGRTLVHLASNDYGKLVLPYLPGERVITCRFLVNRGGKATATVATVRAARGLMARYIVKNRIEEPTGLIGFEEEGYRFLPWMSTGRVYVFYKAS